MSTRKQPRHRIARSSRLKAFLPFRSWRIQVFAVLAAIVAAIASAQSFASAREAATSYLIQPGDTLSAIATINGLSVDKLAGLNNIKDPDKIVAGQTLALGSSGSSSDATSQTVMIPAPAAGYTVKAGDTLWDIAHSNSATVDAIVKLNNLTSADTLKVGQVLVMPAAPATAAGSTSTAAASQRSASAPVKPTATSTATPAKPTPTPTKPAASPLQQKAIAEAQRVGGPNVRVGFAATNLVSGERIAYHADEAFPSASVMKLPILVELERQIAAGNISWTESLRSEVGAMIAVSDNTAANQIATVIHVQSVNDTMSSLSLGSTKMFNLFVDTPTNPGQNQTTAANMTRLLEMIATDQILTPQTTGDIRSLLARNTDRSKLARLLPPDARIAHKSGWFDGVANDVGIVTVDRVPARWVIAVFTQNLPDAETGNQLVAAVSKTVYDAWAP